MVRKPERAPVPQRGDPRASMGPHLGWCGSPDSPGPARAGRTRFNGAAPWMVRKQPPFLGRLGRTCRFNGAAPWMVRKQRMSQWPALAWMRASMGPHLGWCGSVDAAVDVHDGVVRFNGAAPWMVRKPHAGDYRGFRACDASMGPHLGWCGSPCRNPVVCRAPGASMGPHLGWCGSTSLEPIPPRNGRAASMGPHLGWCGSADSLGAER